MLSTCLNALACHHVTFEQAARHQPGSQDLTRQHARRPARYPCQLTQRKQPKLTRARASPPFCVRHEAHCCIARVAGMDWGRCLWIWWLIRDPKGEGDNSMVRREAPHRIPCSAGRNLEGCSWVWGFVLARAAAGLPDRTISLDVWHLEQARAWFGRPLREMAPADADAYFGKVLRGAARGTRLSRAQALKTCFMFL